MPDIKVRQLLSLFQIAYDAGYNHAKQSKRRGSVRLRLLREDDPEAPDYYDRLDSEPSELVVVTLDRVR